MTERGLNHFTISMAGTASCVERRNSDEQTSLMLYLNYQPFGLVRWNWFEECLVWHGFKIAPVPVASILITCGATRDLLIDVQFG